MTSPSSASWSRKSAWDGRAMAPPGPLTEPDALRKKAGGTSPVNPESRAWLR